ncbi:MAG: DUF3037 domain-containing protein [Campylobacterota bacterium]|nr:DUF3037 domain-containing protein [Campylobacterota bacterium]
MGAKYNIPTLSQFDRKYHLVRFYPKKSSYEFINIGIVLYDETNLTYKLMSKEHISKISAHPFLDNKILTNAITNIEALLNKGLSQIELVRHLNNRYKNSVDTSFVVSHLGDESFEDLIDLLYSEYIGYKFPEKSHNDIIVETKAITFEIYKKTYRKFLPIIEDDNFDLSYQRNNKKTNLIIGSLDRQDSIDKVIRVSPIINPLYTKSNDIFDFGYVNKNLDSENENTKVGNRLAMLENAKFNPKDFSDKDKINEFFEKEIGEVS